MNILKENKNEARAKRADKDTPDVRGFNGG